MKNENDAFISCNKLVSFDDCNDFDDFDDFDDYNDFDEIKCERKKKMR